MKTNKFRKRTSYAGRKDGEEGGDRSRMEGEGRRGEGGEEGGRRYRDSEDYTRPRHVSGDRGGLGDPGSRDGYRRTGR